MNMSNDFINDFGLNDSSSSSLLATKTPEPSPSSSSEINAASKTSLNGSCESNSSGTDSGSVLTTTVEQNSVQSPTHANAQARSQPGLVSNSELLYDTNQVDKMATSFTTIDFNETNSYCINETTYTNLSENTLNFKKLFDCFLDVKPKSKLWISTDNSGSITISVDNGIDIFGITDNFSMDFSPFRATTRYLFGQNRQKTYNVLKEHFENYMKFLTYILTLLENNKTNFKVQKCADDNKKFIRTIVVGLYEIKNTYEDYKEMQTLIDSIITTFTDYEKMLDDISEKTLQQRADLRVRSDSF